MAKKDQHDDGMKGQIDLFFEEYKGLCSAFGLKIDCSQDGELEIRKLEDNISESDFPFGIYTIL